MSWIRQNSFLAGFLAITVLGAIALGVLIYFQYDKYSTVSEEFDLQARQWNDLQRKAPFPNEENLKKLRALKQSLDGEIANMLADLSKMSFQVEETTPEQFQDKLRSSVLGLQDLAKQGNVKLPEKFYLGFDGYQSLPPKKEAASLLARQLAGMEWVAKTLLENKISQITAIKRVALPEEELKSSAQPIAQPPQPPAGAGPAKSAGASTNPVQKMRFGISFKAEHHQARNALNAIAQAQNQFFILRSVQIRNENQKAPSRSETEGKPPLNPPNPPSPGENPGSAGNQSAPASMKFVIGTEKVDVDAQIEIANFKTNPGK